MHIRQKWRRSKSTAFFTRSVPFWAIFGGHSWHRNGGVFRRRFLTAACIDLVPVWDATGGRSGALLGAPWPPKVPKTASLKIAILARTCHHFWGEGTPWGARLGHFCPTFCSLKTLLFSGSKSSAFGPPFWRRARFFGPPFSSLFCIQKVIAKKGPKRRPKEGQKEARAAETLYSRHFHKSPKRTGKEQEPLKTS